MWLLVNHINEHFALKLIYFNNGQLQNNSVKDAILIKINRVIKHLTLIFI